MADSWKDALLYGFSAPAFVLSSSKEVLTANDGMNRLLDLPLHERIEGCSIDHLRITLVPTHKPVYRTWDTLLGAALALSNSGNSHSEAKSVSRASGDQHPHQIEDHDLTAEFWNHESRNRSYEEINVVVGRVRGHNSTPSNIGARLRVLATKVLPDQTIYVLSFHRLPIAHSAPTSPQSIHDRVEQPQNDPTETLFDSDKHVRPGAPQRSISSEKRSVRQVVSKLIPHMMGVLDLDGQVLFLSQSWYEFTGIPTNQALGTGWVNSVHPEDAGDMTIAWADVLSNGKENWTTEARYRRYDGVYKYFLVRAEPLLDDDGAIIQWYATMMDINDLVVARLEADRRKESLLTLLSNADVSLWGLDRTGKIYVREGNLPWVPPNMLSPSDTTSNDEPVWSKDMTAGNSKSCLTDLFETMLDGNLFSATREHEAEGRCYRTICVADKRQNRAHAKESSTVEGVLGLTIDVTDVKAYAALQIENESLVLTERAAQEASRLKGGFLANMSHEIRTPIAAIIGLADLLLDTTLSAYQLEMFQGISQSARSLLELINEILDFSKIESGCMDLEATPFTPHRLVGELEKLMILQALHKDVSFLCHNHIDEAVSLVGDFGRLRQIVTNLLSNSFKFTQQGHVKLTTELLSSVDIRQDERAQSCEVLDRPNVPESGAVVLQCTVNDTGCGVDQEVLSKLFQPFSQADTSTARTHGGSGLGLSISRQLAELMGGTLNLKSAPGVGTTATLRIPFMLERAAEASPPTDDTSATGVAKLEPVPELSIPPTKIQAKERPNNRDGKTASYLHPILPMAVSHPMRRSEKVRTIPAELRSKFHILVAEDNALNRKVALSMIGKLGYSSSSAINGEAALQQLAASAKKSRPHLILMDCMMPTMDGYQATRCLRQDVERFDEQMRRIPVIALTASAIKGDQERCEQAGMNDYLTKPVSIESLDRALTRWLTIVRKPKDIRYII